MTRTVTRKYEFSATEVRDALLQYLRVADIPNPTNDADQGWQIGPQGATLEWTEVLGETE